MSSERGILESLDREIRAPQAAAFLSALTAEVSAVLNRDPAARLAWHSVRLRIYDRLPAGIASSWVFVLRANCSSGASVTQEHPARHVFTQGRADMRTWNGERWVSNLLRSEAELPLENRWLSIPANVWHQPVMGDVDWSVSSFHTASDTALIEELPIDDEQPGRGSRAAMVYSDRQAR